jgi:hypothetical protein
MPKATLCPKCSFRWTLSEAAPRSWYCPKCHIARTAETEQNRCTCAHTYAEHDTIRNVGNSLSALTILGSDLSDELIRALPLDPPPPVPPIGKCTHCACENYAAAN